jgi:hypothetical protein
MPGKTCLNTANYRRIKDMKHSNNSKQPQGAEPSIKEQNSVTRRSFAKKLMGLSFLSCLAVMSRGRKAFGWLNGKITERDDLNKGLKVLIKTYNNTKPYPHKFNDALIKTDLRTLDFAKRKGLEKGLAEHEAYVLKPIIDGRIKQQTAEIGKDRFLFWNFERPSCGYQRYEDIRIKDRERSFPCPYKNILEYINKDMGTYKITWNDVCSRFCTLRWEAFAKRAGGVKLKVEPGDICRVKVL